jgi:hypothetical protein
MAGGVELADSYGFCVADISGGDQLPSGRSVVVWAGRSTLLGEVATSANYYPLPRCPCRRREPAQTRAPCEATHSQPADQILPIVELYSSGNGLCMGRSVVDARTGSGVRASPFLDLNCASHPHLWPASVLAGSCWSGPHPQPYHSRARTRCLSSCWPG